MTTLGRGIRNAFRNAVRTTSVVLILGLAIGLSFVMLIAQRSVTNEVATTLSSIGNTVTIGPPPGYSAGGQLGKNLTTAELAPIAHLHGVTSIDEILRGTTKPRGKTTERHALLGPQIVAPERSERHAVLLRIYAADEPGEHWGVDAEHRERPGDFGHDLG